MVVCQVADGVPAYEVKDEAENIKTVHHNWIFLVAALREAIIPLGAGTSISEENIVRSTRAVAYAHSGLGKGPGGGCCPSRVPQVASPKEGYAATQVRCIPQGVPGNRSRDRTGQGVLPYERSHNP